MSNCYDLDLYTATHVCVFPILSNIKPISEVLKLRN